ncbi:hypothetical protein VL15_38310 [Burkholderia cepacia]|uniref:Translocator protein BipD n=2 Tax=Burkholderia cepacia TaxID=292 RepID=A0A0J5VQ29_BURCE|nr:hypothetical protein VL15_38310 [Burkholderia cepacia]
MLQSSRLPTNATGMRSAKQVQGAHVQMTLAVHKLCGVLLDANQISGFGSELKVAYVAAGGGAIVAANDEGSSSDSDFSDFGFCNDLAEAIGDIESNYLDDYFTAMEGYLEFFEAFTNVVSELGGDVKMDSDSNYVDFNIGSLINDLNGLIKNVNDGTLGVLGTFDSKSDADAFAKALGLPSSCVSDEGGSYEVKVDITPLTEMVGDLTSLESNSTSIGNGDYKVDTAAFQAWEDGFDAQKDQVQNSVQVLSQKCNQANSIFDNLVKVLSSTITSMADTDKTFLQS